LAAAGMSQREVAATVGVDQSTVSRSLADADASPAVPADELPAGAGDSGVPAPAGPSDARLVVLVRQDHGAPVEAEVWEGDPDSRNVKVVYLASRTGARVANKRIIWPGRCEDCAAELTEDQSTAGYTRCEDCDSEGEHVGSAFPRGRGKGCVACYPELAEGGEGGVTAAQDEREQDWPEVRTAAGVVDSKTPGGATDEAPGEQDPDAEYRSWRSTARQAVETARGELRLVTGDFLDADVVAQRADEPLLLQLEAVARELNDFVGKVRELRAPATVTKVWMSVVRKGIEYHRPSGKVFAPKANTPYGETVCGRSMRTGLIDTREAAEAAGMKPCPRCWPPEDMSGVGA
jgi:transcriptional regulator with XRE-family HTH domain